MNRPKHTVIVVRFDVLYALAEGEDSIAAIQAAKKLMEDLEEIAGRQGWQLTVNGVDLG